MPNAILRSLIVALFAALWPTASGMAAASDPTRATAPETAAGTPSPAQLRPLRDAESAATSAKYMCRNACAVDRPTPYCLQLPDDRYLEDALSALRGQLLPSAAGRLPKQELMRIFGVREDPCRRGDTVRGPDGVWTNDGEACRLSAAVPFAPGTPPVKLSLEIPALLQFTLARDGDWLTANARNTVARLVVLDPDFHRDWGGGIDSVSSNGAMTLIQVPRGCIRLSH